MLFTEFDEQNQNIPVAVVDDDASICTSLSRSRAALSSGDSPGEEVQRSGSGPSGVLRSQPQAGC